MVNHIPGQKSRAPVIFWETEHPTGSVLIFSRLFWGALWRVISKLYATLDPSRRQLLTVHNGKCHGYQRVSHGGVDARNIHEVAGHASKCRTRTKGLVILCPLTGVFRGQKFLASIVQFSIFNIAIFMCSSALSSKPVRLGLGPNK